jgi:predicted nuclease of predicted toxin-antitoxin system
MRFLANENFPIASVRELREQGHDVVAVLEVEAGAKDPIVLGRAARESRILLTFDRDYGELIYRRNLPSPQGLVYLRFVPVTPQEPAEVVSALLQIEGLDLESRYTIVDRQRVRQRPLPRFPSLAG